MIESFTPICLQDVLSPRYHLSGPPITVNPINSLEQYRWATLLTKEPETIEWICNIPEDGGLLDIGANIGCYSLTALARGLKTVIAIEPFPSNYASLCRSITTNNLEYISAYCFGFSQQTNIVSFRGQSSLAGSAEFIAHDIDETSLANCLLISPSLLPPPLFRNITHIKCDVDGYELDVLRSLTEILVSSQILSVLVEVDYIATEQGVLEFMSSIGYSVDIYYQRFKPHSSDRRASEVGNTTKNIVFSK